MFCFQDEKIKDAEKNQGESELRDALLAKSEYLTKIGEKEEAIETVRYIDHLNTSMQSS